MLLFAKIIGLIGTFLAAVEDSRTTEVPDWLNFASIFGGLGSSSIFSVVLNDASYALNSITGLLAGIFIGYFMYYSRQWGGGDSKLLMGVGTVMGLDITKISQVPELILFLFNILIIGAIYGLIWSFYKAWQHRSHVWKSFKKHLYSDRVTNIRKINLILIALLLVAIIFSTAQTKVMLFGLMVFMILTIYLWVFVRAIEECCMIKTIPVSKLTEGDWVVNSVKIKGKVVAGPKDLGISKEQIELLKKSKVKRITIKQGIPFTPTFFFAFLITIFLGNWVALLI